MGEVAGGGGSAPPVTIYGGALGELDQIDQAVYRAIAATPSPSLDLVLSRLSSAADHSKLWFAVAAALALKPGRPRRAALVGVASIGLASATANLVGKGLLRRARPDRAGLNVPAGRKVKMPGSTSFPSGHSAFAFAFATAVGLAMHVSHPQDECWDFEMPADRQGARRVTRALRWFKENW